MNLENFDWGTSNEWYQNIIGQEIFEDNLYEKFFTVEEGDIVMDFGASIGPFSYLIGERNPKHIFCFEPSFEEFITLVKNVQNFSATCINKGISSENGKMIFDLYGEKNEMGEANSITFKQIIQDYNITKIDFLKTDCEGGEYSVFNNQNIFWIKENVRKVVGEWHLASPERKEQFRIFRDTYLRLFPNIEVFSTDGVNIKWDLWNDHFINYYHQVIIYIDNR